MPFVVCQVYLNKTFLKKDRKKKKRNGCVLSEEIPKAFLHANRHEIEERMRHMLWKRPALWKREDFVR